MEASDSHRRTHGAIDAIWRIESPKLIAALTRMVRDIGVAEDLAQDALLVALEKWPAEGVPANPGAWLMTTAKNRALDVIRRGAAQARKEEELGRELETGAATDTRSEFDAVIEEDVGDDLLRLIFMTCHPLLSTEARIALTLRLLGGLTTGEIARAFLVPEATVGQRISRAKRTLSSAGVPFEVPVGTDRSDRLSSVLHVIYLIFNEGYSATAGNDWVRPGLCEDAMRLGRVVAELAPRDAEVHGLVALMEIQASRLRARVGSDGEPILLLDQSRSQWDHLLIQRGLRALERAEALGQGSGPFVLQAAIAACHARARTADETDWERIVALYGTLSAISRSPVVELNRAVAVSMAFGPAPALAIVDALRDEPALKSYHLLPSVRGDLLEKLDRFDDARAEYERAAEMTQNEREKALLRGKATAVSSAA